MPKIKATTVDAYIKAAPKEAQKHLKELRSILKEVAPKATEAIKWGSPVLEGKRILFAYNAHKSHMNFMPTHSSLAPFKKELEQFKTGKDTMQLPYDQPIPTALIKKIAMHRLIDVETNGALWMG